MKPIIAPSILSADFGYLAKDIEMVNRSEAEWVHIDIMDGVFVPNISFGFPVLKYVAKLSKKPLDVHLMIVNPEKFIPEVKALGAHTMNVHYEACPHLHRVVQQIREAGIRDVTWDSSNINAQLGEQMTMKDCWFAAYIKSANEVCAQIAEYVGGTEANFVDMMNQRAKELGCTHTHFANASGLPDENHYSSPLDLARIMRAGLQNARFRKVIGTVGYTIPATNLSAARPMHTHMPLMAKESDLYYEGCIGGKTGFANEAEHTLVVAAERNGRTYIAVTMRAVDLGINCTDSTALFDYAFNNFDTIDVNGTKMTVPKGVTVNDLTTEQVDRNGKTLNRYYYNGQYVGYVTAADPTPTPTEAPQTVQETTEDTAVQDTGSQTETAQDEQPETKGLSKTSKILLGVMAGMGVLLIILLILLRRKNY